jgi:hypothetical protein
MYKMRPVVGDVPRGLLEGEEGALGVDGEQAVVLIFGRLQDRLVDDFHARVRDDDVGPAELGGRFAEQALQLVGLGHVGLDRDGLDPEVLNLGDRRLRAGLVTPVVHGDAGPEGRVVQRNGFADPARPR